jgi:hypothetical protein
MDAAFCYVLGDEVDWSRLQLLNVVVLTRIQRYMVHLFIYSSFLPSDHSSSVRISALYKTCISPPLMHIDTHDGRQPFPQMISSTNRLQCLQKSIANPNHQEPPLFQPPTHPLSHRLQYRLQRTHTLLLLQNHLLYHLE